MDLSKSQLQVIFKQLGDYLPNEEEVEAATVARNASNTIYVKPALLATDWRVILVEPKNWGISSKARHFPYEQIADIHHEEGWFSAKISITPMPGLGLGAAMYLEGLEKRRSKEFYHYVRDRIGENPVVPPTASTPRVETETDPLVERLKQLKQLLDEGLITETEYHNKKGQILSEI